METLIPTISIPVIPTHSVSDAPQSPADNSMSLKPCKGCFVSHFPRPNSKQCTLNKSKNKEGKAQKNPESKVKKDQESKVPQSEESKAPNKEENETLSRNTRRMKGKPKDRANIRSKKNKIKENKTPKKNKTKPVKSKAANGPKILPHCKGGFSNSENDKGGMVTRAIANALSHGINVHVGVRNLANGNCAFESIIDSINTRSDFQEVLDGSPDF